MASQTQYEFDCRNESPGKLPTVILGQLPIIEGLSFTFGRVLTDDEVEWVQEESRFFKFVVDSEIWKKFEVFQSISEKEAIDLAPINGLREKEILVFSNNSLYLYQVEI